MTIPTASKNGHHVAAAADFCRRAGRGWMAAAVFTYVHPKPAALIKRSVNNFGHVEKTTIT